MAFNSQEELSAYLRNTTECEDGGRDTGTEDGSSEFSDHLSTDSEMDDIINGESSDDGEPLSELSKKILRGKNGHIWSRQPTSGSKIPQRNIVRLKNTGNIVASKIQSEIDAFRLLFNEEIMNIIVNYTNKEIQKRAKNFQDQRYVQNSDVKELEALFGLLFISCINKDNRKDATDMWSSFSANIYRYIMNQNRFEFLLLRLRFDDKELRDRSDKLAPVRLIWSIFIKNCRESYEPRFYVTIDEQLLSFRGKCPFRVYIASKPDKYGLKIVTMCDAVTFYMIDAIPYIGKEGGRSKSASDYVKALAESIRGSWRNITYDNWFTSVPLADEMIKDYQLTTIGTVRKNKREIPPSFLPNKKKEPLSSQFAFDCKKE